MRFKPGLQTGLLAEARVLSIAAHESTVNGQGRFPRCHYSLFPTRMFSVAVQYRRCQGIALPNVCTLTCDLILHQNLENRQSPVLEKV